MKTAARLLALTAAFYVVANSGLLLEITQPLADAQRGHHCTVPADLEHLCR